MEDSGVEVGDVVKITDNGYTYTTYRDMAEHLGAVNWQYEYLPQRNMVGIVKADYDAMTNALGVKYGNFDFVLVRLCEDGRDVIMESRGLEVLEKTHDTSPRVKCNSIWD